MAGELIILAALALVFWPLERLAPVRRVGPDWQRLRTDAFHLVVSGALIRGGIGLLVAGLVLAARPHLPAGLGEAVRGQPTWLQFVEIFLISDFFFYWTHRATHAIPALWRLHEVHHSSEKLDWIAGSRIHPLDWIFSGGTIAASTALFGFSPGPLLAYALIYRFHATLLHANLRVDFGPLRWVIASPHYHQWHHADHPEAWDKNFGGQLVVFDWLFGTLHMPASDQWPERLGLRGRVARDYVGQLLHPFGVRLAQPEPAAALADDPA